MMYVIAWGVFILICIIALPVAAMMEKKQSGASAASYDQPEFAEDEYSDQGEGEVEPLAEGDAFGDAQQDFPAEEMPDGGEPVMDDFSAFDEEFK